MLKQIPEASQFHQKFFDFYETVTKGMAIRSNFAVHNLPKGRGIELGATYYPLLLSQDHYVIYADIRDEKRTHELYRKEMLGQDALEFPIVPDIFWPIEFGSNNLDFFIACRCLEFVANPVRFLETISFHLRHGGRLMLTVSNGEHIELNGRPYTRYLDWIMATGWNGFVRSKRMEYVHYGLGVKKSLNIFARTKLLERYRSDLPLWVFNPMSLRKILDTALDEYKIPMRVKELHSHGQFKEIMVIIERI